jgi:hypothetical protein
MPSTRSLCMSSSQSCEPRCATHKGPVDFLAVLSLWTMEIYSNDEPPWFYGHVHRMAEPTRRPNTFYIDELHVPSTVGNYADVERVVRETLSGHRETETTVRSIMRQIWRCQRRLVRKPRNGRLRAVVYSWTTPSSGRLAVSYGMCTFTDRTGHESYRKRDLRQTALARLRQHPVVFDVPVTQPVTRQYVKQQIGEHIRETIRSGGVD